MKKLLLTVLILLLAAFASLYLFFPATQKLEYSVKLRVPQKALNRFLLSQSLPGSKAKNNVGPSEVVLHPGFYDGLLASVSVQEAPLNGQLRLISLGADSSLVYWSGSIQGASSPLQRIRAWRQKREVATTILSFLENLHRLEDDQVLYGFKVLHETVSDSVLVAKRFRTAEYPATGDIYKEVNQLKQYISEAGAQATNPPMLFVQPAANGYEAQVAVPTNRLLQGKGDIGYRRMVMGNILKAEVRGGQATVDAAIRQLGHYVDDHNHISPAIPFASLVTDRTREPDTTRWVTRIYYPVY